MAARRHRRKRRIAGDQVFKAIGQTFVAPKDAPSIALEGGRIGVDAEGRTSHPKVWAGGDCVADAGEDLTVTAVPRAAMRRKEHRS